MKCLKLSSILLFMFLLHFEAGSSTISYQGKLYDDGSPANGNYSLQFAIFDTEAGGAQLWPESGYETHTVTITEGYYSVILGNGDTPMPIGASVFDTENTWLELKVNTTVMPRIKIHTVPYSIQAQKLSGVTPTAEGDIMRWDGTSWVSVNFKNYYRDKDQDTYGDKYEPYLGFEQPEGYVENSNDCDDDNALKSPGGVEICDGEDNDCDGEIDEDGVCNECVSGETETEQCGSTVGQCEPGTRSRTCQDGQWGEWGPCEGGTEPGVEICDGIDNDCDGDVDEDGVCDECTEHAHCAGMPNAIGTCVAGECVYTCHDGWGDCDGDPDNGCETDLMTDANHCGACGNTCPPGQVCQDGVCVSIGNDADGDGYSSDVDCDDNDPNIHPDAIEICDEKDNDCDGNVDEGLEMHMFYVDNDNDGVGADGGEMLSCLEHIEGYALEDGDCDDNDPNISPLMDEICDGIDNDCDGQVDETCNTYYQDADGDGYGNPYETIATTDDAPPAGYVSNNEDCDDSRANTNPDAPEICDGLDNDCDGLVDADDTDFVACDGGQECQDGECIGSIDADGDGYPADVDCDDNDPAINPGADEIAGDGIDQNCDGQELCYQDADMDGYGTPTQITSTDMDCNDAGEIPAGGNLEDCDDTDPSVYPGAEEVCGDGKDNDCDGQIDEDCLSGIFVSPGGNDDNPGTQSQPMRTINAAISLAVSSSITDVYISSGTYNETVELHSSINLYGGYEPSTWTRNTSVYITQINGGQKAIIGESDNNLIIDGVYVVSANGTSSELSSYGVFLQSCSNLQLSNSNIQAGYGYFGQNGSGGNTGLHGAVGSSGAPGCENGDGICSTCSRPAGGAGGSLIVDGEVISGGHGGEPGLGDAIEDDPLAAQHGLAGNGINGGGGGAAGTDPNLGYCDGNNSSIGANGQPGANGADGSPGSSFGSVSSSGYVPSNGMDGLKGKNGSGGGGGGGGRGGTNGCESYGSSGGGGGSGGGAGMQGTGGLGGGGSFGIFTLNCSGINIDNCGIVTSDGGYGGAGGHGGDGGDGGTGGNGGAYGGFSEQDDGGCGGDGGAGGDGGRGGHGGGGGGGPSIGIVTSSSTVNHTNTTITLGNGGAGGASEGSYGQNGVSQNIYNY